jgi:hypothetical protein
MTCGREVRTSLSVVPTARSVPNGIGLVLTRDVSQRAATGKLAWMIFEIDLAGTVGTAIWLKTSHRVGEVNPQKFWLF